MNRAETAPPRDRYDVAVLGAGMLGLACAYYLRRLAPDASVVVVERGGVPSEDGASYASPAVLEPPAEPAAASRAAWVRERLADLAGETGVHRPHDVPFRPVGLLRLAPGPDAGGHAALPAEARRAVAALVDAEGLGASFVPEGGYGSAEAVALHYGHGAVRLGADLLLATRARPLGGGGLELERLAFERDMRLRVVRRDRLRADRVVVAAGAASAALLEAGLGRPVTLPRAFEQYPRLEARGRLPLADGRVALPVIAAPGATLRPHGDGLLVVPDPLAPDPAGYRPVGGRLLGVPVGLRRELVDALLAAPRLRFLAWEGLDLGKSAERLRGAWQLLGPTRAEALGEGWVLLAGGRDGFALGPAAAWEAAALVAGTGTRPWRS